jgi:asparagine synthase (glutamine-hydrolysing)
MISEVFLMNLMPGISILNGDFSIGGDSETGNETILSAALNFVMHDDRYIQRILMKKDSFFVAYTKYPEYPIMVYEDDQFWVCVEGKIYGQDDIKIKREINELLFEIFFSNNYRGKGESAVDKWLSTTDGEFIIYALNKRNNEFLLINDILGRLPIYYHRNNERLIISRELPFITYVLWRIGDNSNTTDYQLLDKMAIAQYLLFGYTLDKRTLIKDINRVQPGSLARISNGKYSNSNDSINKGIHLSIENLFSFNFEQKRYVNDSLKENIEKLSSLFSEACGNRADLNGNNIISLSGGFDSRIVAACFQKNKIPCRSVTYLEPGWKPLLGNKSESEIAKQVSDILGIDWKDYGPIRAGAKDYLTLLRIKMGSIHLGYSFMLPLLETLNRESTYNTTFFTGYGGDRVLVDLLPPRENKDLDELVSYIMHRESFLSLSEVSKLVQIDEDAIIDELKRVLLLYPEKGLGQKYVHFILYEGSFKAMFEVEDRDRLYFWSTSPFYSIPVFNYVMNCSDANKSSRALHKGFLWALSPSAAAVDNSDYGYSIISYRLKVIIPYLKTVIFRYSILKRIAARIVRNKNRDVLDSKMIMCLRDQMENCEQLSRYFSKAKLVDMANNPAKRGLYVVNHLFTIISFIEKIYSSDSTIDKYYD